MGLERKHLRPASDQIGVHSPQYLSLTHYWQQWHSFSLTVLCVKGAGHESSAAVKAVSLDTVLEQAMAKEGSLYNKQRKEWDDTKQRMLSNHHHHNHHHHHHHHWSEIIEQEIECLIGRVGQCKESASRD